MSKTTLKTAIVVFARDVSMVSSKTKQEQPESFLRDRFVDVMALKNRAVSLWKEFHDANGSRRILATEYIPARQAYYAARPDKEDEAKYAAWKKQRPMPSVNILDFKLFAAWLEEEYGDKSLYKVLTKEFPKIDTNSVTNVANENTLRLQIKAIKTTETGMLTSAYIKILLGYQRLNGFNGPQPLLAKKGSCRIDREGDDFYLAFNSGRLAPGDTVKTRMKIILGRRERRSTMKYRTLLTEMAAGTRPFAASVNPKDKGKYKLVLTYDAECQPAAEQDGRRLQIEPGTEVPWILRVVDQKGVVLEQWHPKSKAAQMVAGIRRRVGQALQDVRMSRRNSPLAKGRKHIQRKENSLHTRLENVSVDVCNKIVGYAIDKAKRKGIGSIEFIHPEGSKWVEGDDGKKVKVDMRAKTLLARAGNSGRVNGKNKSFPFYKVGQMLSSRCPVNGLKFVKPRQSTDEEE